VVFVSDSANAGDVGRPRSSSTPRALIHKKILEAAGSMPDATMAEVADEVSGASTDLVDRVLAEYGDPAATESESESESGAGPGPDSSEVTADTREGPAVATGDAAADPEVSTDEPAVRADGDPTATDGDREQAETVEPETETETETMTDDTPVRAPEELSEKERAVLEVVAERPDATQEEIANVLGVSRATISKRASGIDGFDWQRRATFVDRLFEDEREEEAPFTRGDTESSTVAKSSLERADARADGDRRRPVDGEIAATGAGDQGDIVTRLDRIESRLEDLESRDRSAGGISDPTLAHKVVHACMESDKVSEAEELEVVSAVLNGDTSD
jgi:transcriptional regulator with XRE-family HTH domain